MSTPDSPLPEIQYENDTGPNDEGFWEWWEIPGFGKFDSEENAKRARHCVNTHAALVEALKELRFWCRNASVLASDLSQPEIGLLLKTMNQIIENGLHEHEKDNQTA